MLPFSQCFGSRYSMTSLSEYTRATISVGAVEVRKQAIAKAFGHGLGLMTWGKQPYRPDIPRYCGLRIQAVWALFRLGLRHRLAMIHKPLAPQAVRQILRFAHNVRIASQSISRPQEGFLGIQLLCHPAIAINFCNYL
jgi:hypothetical protein